MDSTPKYTVYIHSQADVFLHAQVRGRNFRLLPPVFLFVVLSHLCPPIAAAPNCPFAAAAGTDTGTCGVGYVLLPSFITTISQRAVGRENLNPLEENQILIFFLLFLSRYLRLRLFPLPHIPLDFTSSQSISDPYAGVHFFMGYAQRPLPVFDF